MTAVKIYKPAKSAMQSGRGKTRRWVVEFEPGVRPQNDSLMGWTGRGDTRSQLRLSFDSREDAIAYAERHGLDYHVQSPCVRKVRPKSYADNFSPDRKSNWTH